MEDRILYNERKELFRNAIQMKKNVRTPLYSNFFTWRVFDSGYALSQALNDFDLMEKIVCDFQERYQFDSCGDLGTRNPIRVLNALGAGFTKVNDESGSVYIEDHMIMEEDEYQELAKDPRAFYWTKAFARYAPQLTLGQLQNGAEEFMRHSQYGKKMNNRFLNEYQCLLKPGAFLLPMEHLFNMLRGIKGVAIDLRKHKDEMVEAMDAMFETITLPALDKALESDTSVYVCDTYFSLLAHSILSVKQFEELYWPYFKRAIDRIIAKNKTAFIMCESTLLRFKDCFQEIPKGVLMVQLEQDDIFEVRKALPNLCLAGGMTTDLLGHGTPRQCVEYAKKLIDGLGDGYVFSQNKMMSYKNDCTRENLLAVNEFVRNYRH